MPDRYRRACAECAAALPYRRGVNEELLALMAGRRGHFRLESGHHGDLWLDVDALFTRPARLAPFVDELARRLSGHSIEVVCGPLTGGAFVAQLAAQRLDAEFCFTERVAAPTPDALYSASYELAGTPDLAGKPVGVVDDVVNAGSAVRSTLASLRAAGAVPVAIGALLMLGRSAAALADEHGLALEATASQDNTLWTPPECPLCADGMALEDLVA